MFSKMCKVAGVAAAGFVLLGPTVARAQVGVISDGVAFTARAVTVPPVQLTGGTGAFTYDSIASACFSYIDAPNEVGVETPAGNVGTYCHVHATGTYTNTLCGTGAAYGQGTVGNEQANFAILFVATVGVLAGTLGDTPGAPPGPPGDPNPEQLLGVAQLAPPIPPSALAPPACTNGFTVTVVAAAPECTPFLTPAYPGFISPFNLGGLPLTCSALS